MIQYVALFLKGIAMGAANVIPGVSGGTIAFITGIYEKLIHSIKQIDLEAAKLILQGKFKAFAERINLGFLISIFAGVGLSIVSLAKLLEYLFCAYPVLTLAFFFGLIIASIFLVGKQIQKWNAVSIVMLLVGTGVAVAISFLNPANSDDGFFYLILCGMVAMSSMILPGLSGSYVLLIMGNYLLVMSAIGELNFGVLGPIAIGAILGLLIFTRLIDFLFQKFKDGTIGLLTGFVAGSLLIIWPWKTTEYKVNANGDFINKKFEIITDTCRDGIVLSYERYIPSIDGQFWMAFGLIVAGALCVWGIEKLGQGKPQ